MKIKQIVELAEQLGVDDVDCLVWNHQRSEYDVLILNPTCNSQNINGSMMLVASQRIPLAAYEKCEKCGSVDKQANRTGLSIQFQRKGGKK